MSELSFCFSYPPPPLWKSKSINFLSLYISILIFHIIDTFWKFIEFHQNETKKKKKEMIVFILKDFEYVHGKSMFTGMWNITMMVYVLIFFLLWKNVRFLCSLLKNPLTLLPIKFEVAQGKQNMLNQINYIFISILSSKLTLGY